MVVHEVPDNRSSHASKTWIRKICPQTWIRTSNLPFSLPRSSYRPPYEFPTDSKCSFGPRSGRKQTDNWWIGFLPEFGLPVEKPTSCLTYKLAKFCTAQTIQVYHCFVGLVPEHLNPPQNLTFTSSKSLSLSVFFATLKELAYLSHFIYYLSSREFRGSSWCTQELETFNKRYCSLNHNLSR